MSKKSYGTDKISNQIRTVHPLYFLISCYWTGKEFIDSSDLILEPGILMKFWFGLYSLVTHVYHWYILFAYFRAEHPHEVFISMEKIMMTIIHNNVDNDKFSLMLVKILLNNLRRENQVILSYLVSFYDLHAILLSPGLIEMNCSFCSECCTSFFQAGREHIEELLFWPQNISSRSSKMFRCSNWALCWSSCITFSGCNPKAHNGLSPQSLPDFHFFSCCLNWSRLVDNCKA